MSRSIRQNVLNLGDNVKANFHKYPGYTADEISHYIHKNIEDDRPTSVIIIAGINDVLKAKREEDFPDVYKISESILDIGRVAKQSSVKNIYIYLELWRTKTKMSLC